MFLLSNILDDRFFSSIFIFSLFFISSCQQEINQKENTIVQPDSTLVQKHGRLRIDQNKIVDKNNQPICLAGNSFFWSNDNWGGEKFYTPEVVSWLKIDWNTKIVRASMGVEDPGGYLDNKISNKNRVKTIVDAAINEGIYVIIDWHSHHAEDYTNESVHFFN